MPNKWKKHLALVEFGLKTKEDLENEVHRYQTNHLDQLINDISLDMAKKEESGFYIISSIPTYDCFKLPNFCAYAKEDLIRFKASLSDDFYRNFGEIWYCKKPYSKEAKSLVGRISFRNEDFLTSMKQAQSIEQVWNCSHREIEKFHQNSETQYLRASREGWGRRYTIDCLKVSSPEDKKMAVEQFLESAKGIEANKQKIEDFLAYLKTLGIHELCLEYMYSSKGFSFIDWDTCDDKKVIDTLFPEKWEEKNELVR